MILFIQQWPCRYEFIDSRNIQVSKIITSRMSHSKPIKTKPNKKLSILYLEGISNFKFQILYKKLVMKITHVTDICLTSIC
jgi:hypothetical protein